MFGLARSGNSVELIQYLPLSEYRVEPLFYSRILEEAIRGDHKNILNYYNYQDILTLTNNVHLDLIPELPTSNFDETTDIVTILLESGYIELVRNLDLREIFKDTRYDAQHMARLNHVDCLAYVYASNINMYRTVIYDTTSFYLLTVSTLDLLLKHGGMTEKWIKTLTLKEMNLLNKVNPDLYDHISH